jgi:TetR/AcrR family transcriptional repressor of nem operon
MSRPVGLDPLPVHETKQRLIEAGLRLMLARGYNAVGIQEVLSETGVPKGSFYHHFASKEEFALQAIDAYQGAVRQLLAAKLGDPTRPPLARVRDFFEGVRGAYESEGYLGCFLGTLGQELSGASELFRRRLEHCLAEIAGAIAVCLEQARVAGDLPPSTDSARMADVLVNAWEGAALRSRLLRAPQPLDAILDFYFAAVTAH